MATRIIKRNDLVGLTSLSFIRPQSVSVRITGTKPATNLYVFFDGVDVGKYVSPSTIGTDGKSYVLTDGSGAFTGVFNVPPATFNTGPRLLKFQDTSTYDAAVVPGSSIGYAQATFNSSGLKQTFQETVTNITENVLIETIIDVPPVREIPPLDGQGGDSGDPLAQTFFTYGIKGGCFVTKIDLFFRSIDSNIPVTLQIRNVVNGYPGSQVVSKYASVTKSSNTVSVSEDALTPTTFTFERPIYLGEDRDFCFVVMTNSNKYNLWTSEFGKVSKETGSTIFEQPFIGTLFKSENNITWSAEQTEDIKFTIYKANYATGSHSLSMKANAGNVLVLGSDLSVVQGSSIVSARFRFQHGNKTGDRIRFKGIDTGVYRGIPSASISNALGMVVISTPDEYSITFDCGTLATSTGTLAASGIINSIAVDSVGSGYTSASIVVDAPPTGTTAIVTPVIDSLGRIVSVTINNPGSGYVSTPMITFTGNGVGATFTVISEAIFVTSPNRKYQNVVPALNTKLPPGTDLVCALKTTGADYSPGTFADITINAASPLNKDAVLVSDTMESILFGSLASTELSLNLVSNNPNVSPIIDTNEVPRLRAHNFVINGQKASVNILSATWVGNVGSFVTTTHQYRVGDTVYIAGTDPEGYSGVFTVLSALSNTTFTVSIDPNPGPYVSGGMTVDSELTPSSGNAQSKYISQITSILTPSAGARVIVTGASISTSSFDVFIRTSLSSSSIRHTAGDWKKLNCDSARNLSSTWAEYKDYEFFIDSLPQFDVYDIKIVLYSSVQHTFPKIDNYRAIILAT